MRKLGFAATLAVVAALAALDTRDGPGRQEEESRSRQPARDDQATIDGNEMKLVYGRPYTVKPGTTEVRKIWGGLVPFGKVWRTARTRPRC